MRPERPRLSVRVLAAVVIAMGLGACADGDDGDGEQTGDDPSAAEDGQGGDELPDELEDLDLPDPNEHIEDGVFRGVGVMLPAPEGWQFDPASFAQGMVIALTEDGSQTMAAQAVDLDDVEQELDYQDLIDTSRDELGGDPVTDEEVELAGAERAHMLRFDELPSQAEDAPTNTMLTVIADGGDGELAMFNYVAPSDEYDEQTEQLLLDESGFDPDSDPATPLPTPGVPGDDEPGDDEPADDEPADDGPADDE